MKKGALYALTLLISFALSAHAYELSPTPEAGLWRSEKRVVIDDEQRLEALRQAQLEYIEGTESWRRALLDEDTVSRATPTIEMECLTTQQVAELVHMETLQREIQRDVPECELSLHPADRSTLNIHGQCQAEHGFNGDMQGQLEIISSYEIRSSFLGRARVQYESTGADNAPSVPASIQLQEISRWTQPDCGSVTPRQRMSF